MSRLDSLDALRGLDMLIILGADAFLLQMAGMFPDHDFWKWTGEQMTHAAWSGLRVYDLVFPLFVFMAGISFAFSFRRSVGERYLSAKKIGVRLWVRAALLVALGWLVNGPITWSVSEMRWASVLGLIGISGALGGTVSMYCGNARRTATAALSILIGVGILQYVWGPLTPAQCVNAAIDKAWLPGILYDGTYDPEGILCIVSAVPMHLLGFLCGWMLISKSNYTYRLLLLMVGIGCGLIALGLCGESIKRIWTPFFVLRAAGIGFLLMALFYWVIDVKGWKAWSYPLRVIGINSLFAYLLINLIPMGALSDRLFGGTLRFWIPVAWQGAASAFALTLSAWLILLYLYHRHMVIKL